MLILRAQTALYSQSCSGVAIPTHLPTSLVSPLTLQVISPCEASGKVVVVPNLHEVQDTVYSEPTVLVAKDVSGEEDIPEVCKQFRGHA